MSNPVTPSDVANRWRPLTDDETLLAYSLLDDAWSLLKGRDATIDARTTAGTLDVGLLRMVETAMVLRVMKNPDGKKQEAIDDYSWTRDNAVSAGLLYVTDEELALLRAPYTKTTRGSIRLVAYGEL
jgi:hypothetical protein